MDDDGAGPVASIRQLFARQIIEDVTLDVLLVRAARAAGCPVGVAAGGTRRSADQRGLLRDGDAPPRAVRQRLPDGGAVWVARPRSGAAGRAFLEELSFAARVALMRHPPSRSWDQLLSVACSRGADREQRLAAVEDLGFALRSKIRCLALAGPAQGRKVLLAGIRERSGHLVHSERADHQVTVILSRDFADATVHDIPTGVHVGISLATSAADAPSALHDACTALRFSQPSTRDRGPYLVEESPIVTADIVGSARVFAERFNGPDLGTLPDVDALDALIASAGVDMLRTLDAVVATESFRKAADRLHLHHNSVAQRVSRAERALGVQLDQPYGKNRMFLALLVRRLRNTAHLAVDEDDWRTESPSDH